MADKDDLIIGLAVVGIALSAVAIGLFIGMNFNRGSGTSRTGYSIERDDRGRFMGIIPIPMSDLL
ncbi:MAG: hypothetical protein ACTSPB_17180 [Candidatus Thorarchaeota archaeon]